MQKRPVSALIIAGFIVFGSGTSGGAQDLADPGFEALAGKTVTREATTNAWSIPPGQPYADNIEVEADAAAAHGGKTGLRLRSLIGGRMAAVHQSISQLPPGIYEFRIWAKGKGILILKTEFLRRRGDLTENWAEYSLTFEQARVGSANLAVLVDGDAQVDDASLVPASAERQAAWKAQEKARTEYGFIPEYFAAQSSHRGAPAKLAGTFQGGPVVWREKAVFYDQHYDTCWVTHPEILARYLGANGFNVLEAAPFGEWIKKATREGAYGTVCVMTHGLCPASVYASKGVESPIRKYMEAGGRVVWIGDVPFQYMQDDAHPQVFGVGMGTSGGGLDVLGIRAGWNYACWGSHGEPKISALGAVWGLTNAGGPIIAAYPEDITAALSGFHSDYADSDLSVSWFKNFNALCPWSGFIMGFRASDMSDPALQQSIYRLALYAGQPVAAPAGIAVQKDVVATAPLKVVLDPPRGRRHYYRGEKIPVRIEVGAEKLEGVLRLSLTPCDDGRGGTRPSNGSDNGGTTSAPSALLDMAVPQPTKDVPSQAEIPAADLACGDYQLTIQTIDKGKTAMVYTATVSLCPRHEDPSFFFGIKTGGVSNPYRQEMLFRDLVSAGVNAGSLTIETPPNIFDRAIKYGLRFSLRAHGNAYAKLDSTEREAAEQGGPNGEKIAGAWEGGRPILGLLHPKRRQLDAEDIAQQVKELAAWPGCWPRCETSDDFFVYYGWDYSTLAKRLFKEKTGLDAPVPPEIAKLKEQFKSCGQIDRPKGVVPDIDPWLQWTVFTTKDILGGYNRTVTEACVKAVPDLKIGPLPSPMTLPPWVWGQYPPHSFGAEGFNLLEYYYYLSYWQPLIANLYSDEIARLNNRGLELWTSPDCCYNDEANYMRNTFFLHLAGGCQGINYYCYTEAKSGAWKELGRLGHAVVRPLYPFLGKLRPVQTEHGFLLPYAQFAHLPLYPTAALYAYANLLGAHIDVQPTCEEEALSGYIKNYKTLMLWHVEWMRASAVKALEEYIANGGVVLADLTTTVPIKGAVKLPVDLAMGNKPSKPDANDPRLGGPGITDYLHPDRLVDIGKAIAPYAQPWAECANSTLIARRHAYRGVTYLWLVNIHNQEEYEYVRGGIRTNDPVQARTDLGNRFKDERFTSRVSIPTGDWAAYDVLKGQRVPLEKQGNRLAFTADMERLGGTLIALYPEPIERVTATVVTDANKNKSRFLSWFGFGGARIVRGQSATLNVTVCGPSGKPLPGTQPLAVTVITPKGEWPEITGAHATDDGVWSTAVHPALNDPAGTWTIRVKELSSGVVGETSIQVE